MEEKKKSHRVLKIAAFVLIALVAGAGTGVIMNMIPNTEKTAPVEIVENPNAAIRIPAEEEHYIFELDDSVERTHVYYTNRFGIELAADLYMAKDADTGKKYPAIIVGPPFGDCQLVQL